MTFRLHLFRNHLRTSPYNYHVAAWRRFLIASSALISMKLFGWTLWKLAPFSLVD